MKFRSGLLAALLVVSALVVSGGSAQANWWGPTGLARSENEVYKCLGPNITENQGVTFGFDPSTVAVVENAVNWTRTELLNPTDISTSVDPSPGPHIDVYVISKYYTDWCEAQLGVQWTADGVTGLLGMANCETKMTVNEMCDKANVRLSREYFDAQGTSAERFLVCHEVGHAIGLQHRQDGCMRKCPVPNTPAYSDHDIAHFNGPWTTPSIGVEPTC